MQAFSDLADNRSPLKTAWRTAEAIVKADLDARARGEAETEKGDDRGRAKEDRRELGWPLPHTLPADFGACELNPPGGEEAA